MVGKPNLYNQPTTGAKLKLRINKCLKLKDKTIKRLQEKLDTSKKLQQIQVMKNHKTMLHL